MEANSDLTGKAFSFWTVLTSRGRNSHGKKVWLCKCVCGTEKEVSEPLLTSQRSLSCGCRNGIDLTGQRFGKLIAVEPTRRVDGVRVWRCLCDCGKEPLVRMQSLTNGDTKSCGCLRVERIRAIAKKKKPAPKFRSLRSFYNSYKQSADRKGIEFKLSFENFVFKVIDPCAYCGVDSDRTVAKSNRWKAYLRVNGLDRIDSSQGYYFANVVACCRRCNSTKGAKPAEDYRLWLVQTVKFQIAAGFIKLSDITEK